MMYRKIREVLNKGFLPLVGLPSRPDEPYPPKAEGFKELVTCPRYLSSQ